MTLLNFFHATKGLEKRFNTEDAENTEFAEKKENGNPQALMTEAENFVGQPSVDGVTQLVEFAGEEMIDAFDDHETSIAVKRGDERFDSFDSAVFVVASMNK
jgi:hypothetical protein